MVSLEGLDSSDSRKSKKSSKGKEKAKSDKSKIDLKEIESFNGEDLFSDNSNTNYGNTLHM